MKSNLWIRSASDLLPFLPLSLTLPFLHLLSLCLLFDPFGLPPPGRNSQVKTNVRQKMRRQLCWLETDCLFVQPCSHCLCPSVIYRATGCAGGVDGHLGWLIRLWKCTIKNWKLQLMSLEIRYDTLQILYHKTGSGNQTISAVKKKKGEEEVIW